MGDHFTAQASGIAVDKLVYIKSTSGIDHEVGIADAGDPAKLPVVGIVDAVISASRVRVRTNGTHFTGDTLTLTAGEQYYAPTPGGAPTTTPSAWAVGVALSARQLLLTIGEIGAPSGGFLSPADHEQLRQLPHLIPLSGPTHTTNSGKYIEVTYSGAWESAVRWWKSAAMGATDLMASVTITRNLNQTVSLEVWREYASDGVTVVRTVSRAFTYSGVRETSITETIT
jgi:hypothetical protein